MSTECSMSSTLRLLLAFSKATRRQDSQNWEFQVVLDNRHNHTETFQNKINLIICLHATPFQDIIGAVVLKGKLHQALHPPDSSAEVGVEGASLGDVDGHVA